MEQAVRADKCLHLESWLRSSVVASYAVDGAKGSTFSLKFRGVQSAYLAQVRESKQL